LEAAMAETVEYRHEDLSIDRQLALRTAAARLAGEFADVYGVETIERFLHASYDQFASRSTVPNFLPLLAERFARQRLHALARAVAAMAERGIDISGEYPKPWTDEVVRAADVVVTMGCGDACPVFPGTRYENWEVDDPAGLDLADVRPIRDELERRVRHLLDQLGVAAR
jgi:arsenate reductase (thioredoxin)